MGDTFDAGWNGLGTAIGVAPTHLEVSLTFADPLGPDAILSGGGPLGYGLQGHVLQQWSISDGMVSFFGDGPSPAWGFFLLATDGSGSIVDWSLVYNNSGFLLWTELGYDVSKFQLWDLWTDSVGQWSLTPQTYDPSSGNTVPEPASWTAAGAGLLLVAAALRRARRKRIAAHSLPRI
jgi:MYXO-CTERM domain-containing protein